MTTRWVFVAQLWVHSSSGYFLAQNPKHALHQPGHIVRCVGSESFCSPTLSTQVHLDGEKTHTHESYFSGTNFNTLNVVADGVTTVMLESVGLTSDEWISLIEVSGDIQSRVGEAVVECCHVPRNTVVKGLVGFLPLSPPLGRRMYIIYVVQRGSSASQLPLLSAWCALFLCLPVMHFQPT